VDKFTTIRCVYKNFMKVLIYTHKIIRQFYVFLLVGIVKEYFQQMTISLSLLGALFEDNCSLV
ncbi:MAG: hypothetical protein WAM14_21860, partial [Candidatus Nitrosopolaris sp.]